MAKNKRVTPLRENLARMMEASIDGPNQTALAKKSGVSQSTIGRLLRGDTDAQADTLEALAKALGTTVGALVARPEPQDIERVQKRDREIIPLLSWAHGGASKITPPDAELWLRCPTKCGAQTFALRIEGESMKPDYEPGDIIYVDPDIPAVHGCDIVVRLSTTEPAILRRLLQVRTRRYLKTLNPERVVLFAGARLAGVVFGKWTERMIGDYQYPGRV